MRMFFAWTIIGAAFAFLFYIATHQGRNHDHDLQWIGEQHALEQDGRALEKQFDFDGAIKKYEAAIEYDRKLYGGVEGRPMAFMAEAYQNKHDYETALKLVKQLKAFHTKHQRYIDWEKELQALIQFDQTDSPQAVHDYINYYQKKNAAYLPPITYSTVGSNMYVSDILRLYDTIGDYDAGIAYVEECINFFRRQDIRKYGEYKQGHVDDEFIKVREAFEQDKAEGKKGCVGKKPGEVCLGRATKALIQSDEFPW